MQVYMSSHSYESMSFTIYDACTVSMHCIRTIYEHLSKCTIDGLARI
jgi:hypothetical protein